METIVKTINVTEFIKKINRVELMLEEIKQGLSLFDSDFQNSIKRGEKDLKDGKYTLCKTENELDEFFASI